MVPFPRAVGRARRVEAARRATLHCVRSFPVRQRAATTNAARGLLGEFGLVAAKGIGRVDDLRRDMEGTNEDDLPREARTALDALFDHLDALTAKLGAIGREILAWHKTSAASRRLATAPGVGPLRAPALIASVGMPPSSRRPVVLRRGSA